MTLKQARVASIGFQELHAFSNGTVARLNKLSLAAVARVRPLLA